jgi:ATP-binding cassette subfamily B protein
LGVTSDLITGRAQAAEVRAFTTQDALLGEHRRIGCQLTAEAVKVEHRKTTIQAVGRVLAGVGGALAYGVLGLLLYSGAMPLALAGAAAVAMRTASTATSATIFAANRLYRHSFYLDLVTRCLSEACGYHRVTAGLRLPRDPQLIEVQEVSFTYPGADEPALRGVSVTIRRGVMYLRANFAAGVWFAGCGARGAWSQVVGQLTGSRRRLIAGLSLPAGHRVGW